MPLTLTAVRFYTQLDPYFYSVDNRPLEDLEARDAALSTEMDNRTHPIDVAGDATINKLPSGWTASKTATGKYTITHNLGHTNYVVHGSCLNTGTGGIFYVVAINANTVDVATNGPNATATDQRFMAILSEYTNN